MMRGKTLEHPNEDRMLLHHYGEPDGIDVSAHLAHCAPCAKRYAALVSDLERLDAAPVPPRPADYGQQVWRRLEPRLTAPRRWSFALRPSLRLAWVMIPILVLGAFWVGRWQGNRDALRAMPEGAAERILQAAIDDHLEQSRRLLKEVLNTPRPGPGASAVNRARARRLVGNNRLYRHSVRPEAEAELRRLLDELERVLVEIANRSVERPVDWFELQRRIGRRGLLPRVDMMMKRSGENDV